MRLPQRLSVSIDLSLCFVVVPSINEMAFSSVPQVAQDACARRVGLADCVSVTNDSADLTSEALGNPNNSASETAGVIVFAYEIAGFSDLVLQSSGVAHFAPKIDCDEVLLSRAVSAD